MNLLLKQNTQLSLSIIFLVANSSHAQIHPPSVPRVDANTEATGSLFLGNLGSINLRGFLDDGALEFGYQLQDQPGNTQHAARITYRSRIYANCFNGAFDAGRTLTRRGCEHIQGSWHNRSGLVEGGGQQGQFLPFEITLRAEAGTGQDASFSAESIRADLFRIILTSAGITFSGLGYRYRDRQGNLARAHEFNIGEIRINEVLRIGQSEERSNLGIVLRGVISIGMSSEEHRSGGTYANILRASNMLPTNGPSTLGFTTDASAAVGLEFFQRLTALATLDVSYQDNGTGGATSLSSGNGVSPGHYYQTRTTVLAPGTSLVFAINRTFSFMASYQRQLINETITRAEVMGANAPIPLVTSEAISSNRAVDFANFSVQIRY